MQHLIKLTSGEATELKKLLIQDKLELSLKNTMKPSKTRHGNPHMLLVFHRKQIEMMNKIRHLHVLVYRQLFKF